MSHSNPYSDFDSAPKRDPRGPASIPNVHAVNEVTPTQEVRVLINDLQNAARDARARATLVEQERDDLAARLAEAKTQLAETRQQFVEVSSLLRERDDAVARADRSQHDIRELQRQVEAHSKERLDAVRARDDNARLARESARKLDEIQRQLLSIREARDNAQTTNLQLNQQLRELREDLTFAADERDHAIEVAQRAEKTIADLRSELTSKAEGFSAAERDDLTKRFNALQDEVDGLRRRDAVQTISAQEYEKRFTEMATQLELAAQARKDAEKALSQAGNAFEALQVDRERSQKSESERVTALETELGALKTLLAQRENELADADRRQRALKTERDSFLDKADQAESQRLCAIDLAAQLENAKRDLISLAASLAEARLQKSNQNRLNRASGQTSHGAPELKDEAPEGANEDSTNPLSEKEARKILTEVKRCCQDFSRNPSDLSLLNELHCHMHQLSDRARVSGFVALHRLTSAFSLFAQELYRFPEQINPSSQRTLQQTVEFIGVLVKQRDFSAIKDPSTALIYAVDDDEENCEAIKLAMETVGLRTRSSQEPVVALSELATTHFDLVFLDVHLPNMDGFELCQHIRQIPAHAKTPVIFLTGLTSIENQVQSSLSGGDDFVGKPFNLHEISVKALTLILKGSLHAD